MTGSAHPVASTAPDSIAVIISVLDEASQIDELLTQLDRASGIDEIVVVDGGSRDATRELVHQHSGVRWVEAARGRATQMNAGAARTRSSVLWFLHADVRLPPEAVEQVRRALADSAVVAGAFRTWTVRDDGRAAHGWLSPLLHLADLRSRWSGVPYGDQALFVRRTTFEQVGGVPDLPLMEDVALSLELRRRGRIRRVRASVTVSGRRFLERPVYYTTLVNLFSLLFRLGIPVEWMARRYHPVRARGSRSRSDT